MGPGLSLSCLLQLDSLWAPRMEALPSLEPGPILHSKILTRLSKVSETGPSSHPGRQTQEATRLHLHYSRQVHSLSVLSFPPLKMENTYLRGWLGLERYMGPSNMCRHMPGTLSRGVPLSLFGGPDLVSTLVTV